MNSRRRRTTHRRIIWILAVTVQMHILPAICFGDVYSNVPEAVAEGYQLVYTLPIEDAGVYASVADVPYSVDNSATLSGPFDRVAYYLELDAGQGVEYAYASMDAFTTDITRVGLPVAGSGAHFQQGVANLNVYSNSANVTPGTNIPTGNVELWPTDYAVENSAPVPGASDAVYDFGDRPLATGSYGSLQVHDYSAGQTILAYNQWGGRVPGSNSDLGIGNSPSGNPDWTFRYNAADYATKNLQVLVRPSILAVDADLQRAVFQRDSQNAAEVPIEGSVAAGVGAVEARAIPRQAGWGAATDWQLIAANPAPGSFAGTLALEGGWYDIEIRAVDGATVLTQRTVERVGVGEVFVTAGQSNSSNWGEPRLSPVDDRVSAFDLTRWRRADDPQPIADQSGGSPWPALGDALAAELGVPIGFASVGWGGTSVDEWLPGAAGPDSQPLYNRLQAAVEAFGSDGVRAVLWHQGESDNILNTSTADYRQRLESVIAQSRIDAAHEVPWGIAQASYLPAYGVDQAILDAQLDVATSDQRNFVGAATDDLTGAAWRWDGVHFNEAGLREHAQRWLDALLENFDFVQFTADFNADDVVDAADLDQWSAGWGIVGDALLIDGDANSDQDVDGDDLLAWQRNFGRSVAGQNAGIVSNRVPEPAARAAICAAMFVVGVCGRRGSVRGVIPSRLDWSPCISRSLSRRRPLRANVLRAGRLVVPQARRSCDPRPAQHAR